MPGFHVPGARACQVHISLRWVAIVITGIVTPAGQENLLEMTHFFEAEACVRADFVCLFSLLYKEGIRMKHQGITLYEGIIYCAPIFE